MKNIDQFISEKFKFGKNKMVAGPVYDRSIGYDRFNVEVPGIDENTGEPSMDNVVKLKGVPQANYVIFKDAYRYDMFHFANFTDFIMNVCFGG